jgi:hypothetical protein
MVSHEDTTRFDLDMDGSMEPSEHGRWVRHEDFVRAISAEREACAKLCEKTPPWPFRPSIEAAHAIRARSQS